MPQILQATKITRNGRISLGREAMNLMDAKVGDYIKIFEQDGFIWLSKETVPYIAKEVRRGNEEPK